MIFFISHKKDLIELYSSFNKEDENLINNYIFLDDKVLDFNFDNTDNISKIFRNIKNLKKIDINKLLIDYNIDTILNFVENNKNFDEMNTIVNNHILFNKYILGLSKKCNQYNYQILKTSSLTKNICQIHCFKLSFLTSFFNEYLYKLSLYFDIIVTFSILDDESSIQQFNFTFIQCENRGYDIGPKFITFDYLKQINYNYDYIFYIHSKSNKEKREEYLKPFINNIDTINNYMITDKDIGGIFNDLILLGDSQRFFYKSLNKELDRNNINWIANFFYMNEINDFLDLNKNNYIFNEGSFIILNKKIIEKIFSEKLFYYILNESSSFDYQWVKFYYKLNNYNIQEVYDYYKKNHLFGNNIESNLGWQGLADSMIEHTFERIPILLINKLNMKIKFFSENNKKDNKLLLQLEDFFLNTQNIDKNSCLEFIDQYRDNICIIACHTNDNLKLKTLLNNLKYLMELSNTIIIINSSEFKDNNIEEEVKKIYNDKNIIYDNILSDYLCDVYKNRYIDLQCLSNTQLKHHWVNNGIAEGRCFDKVINIKFIYYDNNNMLCQGKWLTYLNSNNISIYNRIILTNDSFIITRKLTDFNKLCASDNELVGLIDSNECKYHYTDFLRCYSQKGIKKYIDFLNKNVDHNLNYWQLVCNFEIDSTNIFDSKVCLYKTEPEFKKNIHFYENKMKEYLYSKNYPIIKLKSFSIIKYESFSDVKNFEPYEYKSANPDLACLTDEAALEHYKNCGINEDRMCKISKSPPQYIIEYLTNIGFYI